MTSVLHVDMTDPSPIPAGKIQDALPHSVTNSHAPREHDGLTTVFELTPDQEQPRKINGSLEESGRPSSAGGVPRPRGGSV